MVKLHFLLPADGFKVFINGEEKGGGGRMLGGEMRGRELSMNFSNTFSEPYSPPPIQDYRFLYSNLEKMLNNQLDSVSVTRPKYMLREIR